MTAQDQHIEFQRLQIEALQIEVQRLQNFINEIEEDNENYNKKITKLINDKIFNQPIKK